MSKSIIISERDNIAAVLENGKVVEFFIHRSDVLLGDIYLSKVENVLPSIDAAFVNVGVDKMGFLHASDIVGSGPLNELVKPKQNLIVQVVKEPTGHKGPRVTTAVSIPGRFLVVMPNEKGINVSKKISSAKERARLKSIVSVMKPPGVGVIIRTEAEGQSEAEIQEDLELLLENWKNVVTAADTITAPNLLHRDQDLLYKVIREACTEEIDEIVVDTSFAYHRAQQLLQSWNITPKVNLSVHKEKDSILTSYKIDKEIKNALLTKVNLPCGGYLYIQQTEALTVIDVNSGKFVSSATQKETILKTNLESVDEIARQLRLRNIGGMIIIDFIDMDDRVDQITVLEQLELALEPDKSNPQIGQLSDLGLVELTRHRQGQSLAEVFTKKCQTCAGSGRTIEEFNFVVPPQEAEMAAKMQKLQHYKPGAKAQGAAQIKQQKGGFQHKKGESFAKKISASPAVNAATAQKSAKMKQRQKEEAPKKISEETIANQLKKGTFLPNISKVVRFTAVPSEIARNNLGKSFRADVFTILGEIESVEAQIQKTAAKPSPVRKAENQQAKKKPQGQPREDQEDQEAKEPKKAEEKPTRKTTGQRRRTSGARKPSTAKNTTPKT